MQYVLIAVVRCHGTQRDRPYGGQAQRSLADTAYMQRLDIGPAQATRVHPAATDPETPRLLAVVRDAVSLERLQAVATGHCLELVIEGDAERALQRLAAERFEIVISEWDTADVDGPGLLATARRRRPETVRMLIGPVTEAPALLASMVDAGIYRLLPRPLQIAELRRCVDEALAYHRHCSQTAR